MLVSAVYAVKLHVKKQMCELLAPWILKIFYQFTGTFLYEFLLVINLCT